MGCGSTFPRNFTTVVYLNRATSLFITTLHHTSRLNTYHYSFNSIHPHLSIAFNHLVIDCALSRTYNISTTPSPNLESSCHQQKASRALLCPHLQPQWIRHSGQVHLRTEKRRLQPKMSVSDLKILALSKYNRPDAKTYNHPTRKHLSSKPRRRRMVGTVE
jgi:hypothetical protein